jgi:DNA (cytosine-5)-methyltransferase 1
MVMQQCFSKSKRAQSATDNETWVESDTANTLNAFDVGDVRTTEAVVCGFDVYNQCITGDVAKSLNSAATDTDHIPCVLALDRASFNQGKNVQYDFEVSDKGINSPIVAKGPSAVCYSTNHGSFHTIAEEGICATLQATDYKDPPTATYRCGTRYIVRRLTPLECERLQGYPDGWTDIGEYIDSTGKKRQTSDAQRYKCLGNSIALPPWKWILKRISACYERDATMASLFDGIGGFPYLWEQLNGKGTCLWASEIEEFPIAVTKARIGE